LAIVHVVRLNRAAIRQSADWLKLHGQLAPQASPGSREMRIWLISRYRAPDAPPPATPPPWVPGVPPPWAPAPPAATKAANE
jgi:hypothetical protein